MSDKMLFDNAQSFDTCGYLADIRYKDMRLVLIGANLAPLLLRDRHRTIAGLVTAPEFAERDELLRAAREQLFDGIRFPDFSSIEFGPVPAHHDKMASEDERLWIVLGIVENDDRYRELTENIGRGSCPHVKVTHLLTSADGTGADTGCTYVPEKLCMRFGPKQAFTLFTGATEDRFLGAEDPGQYDSEGADYLSS